MPFGGEWIQEQLQTPWQREILITTPYRTTIKIPKLTVVMVC